MAKGKKSSGNTYTSKGERSNVDRKIVKAMRRDYMESGLRAQNQVEAWRKGRNVVVTIPNPNKNETNKRLIKVRAKDVWPNPAERFRIP